MTKKYIILWEQPFPSYSTVITPCPERSSPKLKQNKAPTLRHFDGGFSWILVILRTCIYFGEIWLAMPSSAAIWQRKKLKFYKTISWEPSKFQNQSKQCIHKEVKFLPYLGKEGIKSQISNFYISSLVFLSKFLHGLFLISLFFHFYFSYFHLYKFLMARKFQFMACTFIFIYLVKHYIWMIV